MKRSWYLQRKINFNIQINNQLGPVWRANFSKMFGYLFFSALGPQSNISTLSTLVFLLLQKFEFTLHFKFCCVISEWSRNFNPSSFLLSQASSVHLSYIAGASLGEELIEISSLGGGDLILYGLIGFKIYHMPSCGWAMITKIVHQLKLFQLRRFDEHSPTMARVITSYQTLMTT